MNIFSETEKAIQQAIMNYLRYKGYYVMRLNSGAVRAQHGGLVRLSAAGTPDLLAFKKINYGNYYDEDFAQEVSNIYPEILFIEVKRKGNKPTYLQEMKMKELETFGARCLVATSIDDLTAINI